MMMMTLNGVTHLLSSALNQESIHTIQKLKLVLKVKE
jgi:hypothetical protein